MMSQYRLRITVEAGSGALARVGRAIEQLGGTITTVDLQHGGDQRGVCEATVRLSDDVAKLSVIAAALESSRAGTLSTFEAVDYAVDPVLRAIRWACSIVGAGALADDELQRVVAEICSTDDAWFMPIQEAASLEAVQLALERSSPVITHSLAVPEILKATFCGAADILAVPDARLEPTGVAIIIKPPKELFSSTEIERVEAMLALRRRAALLDAYVADIDDESWLNTASPS